MRTGLWLAPLLLVAALLLAWLLPPKFLLVLAAYYGLTVVYSYVLKGQALIDVLALAALYTLRIVAGAAAIEVELSLWLLWFSMFHSLQRQNHE